MRRYLYGVSLAACSCLMAIEAKAATIDGFQPFQSNDPPALMDRLSLITVVVAFSCVILAISWDLLYKKYRGWVAYKRLHRLLTLERMFRFNPCKPR